MNRKVTITKWAMALFNITTWIYIIACGLWPESIKFDQSFFTMYVTGNVTIGGAFIGGNMYEHKQTAKKEIK